VATRDLQLARRVSQIYITGLKPANYIFLKSTRYYRGKLFLSMYPGQIVHTHFLNKEIFWSLFGLCLYCLQYDN